MRGQDMSLYSRFKKHRLTHSLWQTAFGTSGLVSLKFKSKQGLEMVPGLWTGGKLKEGQSVFWEKGNFEVWSSSNNSSSSEADSTISVFWWLESKHWPCSKDYVCSFNASTVILNCSDISVGYSVIMYPISSNHCAFVPKIAVFHLFCTFASSPKSGHNNFTRTRLPFKWFFL